MSLLPIVTATDPMAAGVAGFDGAAAAGGVPSGSGFVVATGSTAGAPAGSGVEITEGGEAAPAVSGAGAARGCEAMPAGGGAKAPLGGGEAFAGATTG